MVASVDDVREENASIVVDYLNRAWNGDGSLDENAVTDDYVAHVDRLENTYTLDEMQEAVAKWREAIPDVELEITETVATEEMVAVQYRWSGTHEAEVLGVQPSGETVGATGLVQFHVEDGQLTEAWYVEDSAGVREQLEEAGD